MTETLAKAWSLFDAGNYTDAETLYKDRKSTRLNSSH